VAVCGISLDASGTSRLNASVGLVSERSSGRRRAPTARRVRRDGWLRESIRRWKSFNWLLGQSADRCYARPPYDGDVNFEPSCEAKRHPDCALVSVAFVALVVFLVGAAFLIPSVIASGITNGPDNMFGDQYMKTAVALIELHKVRYGKYPDSLWDLKFTGQWDQIALQSVSYYPNADHSAYYIEVEPGWVGKPTMEIPDEFGRGTGYSAALKPKDHK
jgi:hypothetical protein